MKIKFFLLLILSVVFSDSLISQNSGYLGKKFQIQINYSPNLGLNLKETYNNSSDDVSEELLIGGTSGIGAVTMYGGFNVSASYVVSRKGTLGFSYGQSQLFGEGVIELPSNYYSEYDLVLVQLNNNTFKLKYDIYTGIAPLKRYIRAGIGVDVITVDQEKFDFDIDNTSNIFDSKDVVPFLTLGFGGNEFISENIYINYGVDMDLSTASAVNSANSVGSNDFELSTLAHLRNGSFFELLLGIGINL